jgi:hypothetical protein
LQRRQPLLDHRTVIGMIISRGRFEKQDHMVAQPK